MNNMNHVGDEVNENQSDSSLTVGSSVVRWTSNTELMTRWDAVVVLGRTNGMDTFPSPMSDLAIDMDLALILLAV